MAFTVIAVGTYGDREKAPPKYQTEVSYASIDMTAAEIADMPLYSWQDINHFDALNEDSYSVQHEKIALESRRWCSMSDVLYNSYKEEPARRALINPPKLC
jgi:hypothetical protein